MPHLIIVEKPQLFRLLKEKELIPSDADVVAAYGFGLWQARLPNGLTFADIPCTPTPVFNRPSKLLHNVPGARLTLQAGRAGDPILTASEGPDAMIKWLNERLPEYDEIIVAADADYTGQWAAQQILDRLEGDLPPVRRLKIDRLDQLPRAWAERTEGAPWAEPMLAHARLKRAFDFWWACNSLLVFGELQKACNLNPAVPISKNEIPALQQVAMNEGRSMSVQRLYRIMQEWSGTGAYSKQGGDGRLGTPTSHSEIIKQLVNRGALKEVGNTLCVTSRGLKFLTLLHPKSLDADLPFRISAWGQSGKQGFAAAKRYIRTYFGRQLRFQRNWLQKGREQEIGGPGI